MTENIKIVEADVKTIARWLENDEALLVDVRETAEYEQEHIPGSMLVPLSVLDPSTFPHITYKKLVLHCAIGKRSAAVARKLIEAGHNPPVNMQGGLKAWREAGLETEVFDVPAVPELPAPIKPSEVSPGTILQREFMGPLNVGMDELARDIGLSMSHIAAVVGGERGIDADIAYRLARYFSTTEDFWLRLQIAHDMKQAQLRSGAEITQTITPRKQKDATL